MKYLARQRGLTMIELLLVVGILSLLFGIATISLTNINVITTNSCAATVLISDLKTQQIKAMVGDTEGRGVPDNYGIKILSNQYVLFHGDSYNPSDPSNFSIPMPDVHTITSTFLNDIVLFASNSGELANFTDGQNSITITSEQSGKTQTLLLNKYGTIINLN